MEELLRLLGIDTTGMSVEELRAHQGAIQAEMNALVAAGTEPTDEMLGHLIEGRDAVLAIGATVAGLEADAARRADEVAAILEAAGIVEAGGDPDPDPDPATVIEPAEVVELEAVEPVIEPTEVIEPEVVVPEVVEPVAVAASARVPRVSRVASRAPRVVPPASTTPRTGHVREWNARALTASGAPGNVITDERQLGDLFFAAFEAGSRFQTGQSLSRENIPVIQMGPTDTEGYYGSDRFLDRDARANMTKVMNAQDPRNFIRGADLEARGVLVAAAGGICAPQQVQYDIPVVGSTARPVRNSAVATLGADRGGVRMFPFGLLDEVDSLTLLTSNAATGNENTPWSVWTNDNDINPGSDGPDIKPCFEIDCPEDEEFLVEAITRCLIINNFRQRFFPELVAAYIEKLAIRFARLMERRLLSQIADDSTTVTVGQTLGSARDVLTNLDRAVAAMRNRWRLETNFPLRFVAPRWLLDMMRTDLARALPTGSLQENLAAADSTIASWITTRGVNITWAMDGETGQDYGAQGDGALDRWKDTAITYLYPEGSHVMLDGGSQNFGVVRDSVLIRQNKFMMFEENWEGHFFHGPESQRITMDLCPDGSVSGTVYINPCTIGS